MPDHDHVAREFAVETNFQKLARRPGGISREQALKQAEAEIATYKPGFEAWLNAEIEKLFALVPDIGTGQPSDLSWIEAADIHSQRLADVAATMSYQFVSFVAANLCVIFEAIRNGAAYDEDVIACHIGALQLARQEQYRRISATDLPELSDGLRRVLNSPRLQPKLAPDD